MHYKDSHLRVVPGSLSLFPPRRVHRGTDPSLPPAPWPCCTTHASWPCCTTHAPWPRRTMHAHTRQARTHLGHAAPHTHLGQRRRHVGNLSLRARTRVSNNAITTAGCHVSSCAGMHNIDVRRGTNSPRAQDCMSRQCLGSVCDVATHALQWGRAALDARWRIGGGEGRRHQPMLRLGTGTRAEEEEGRWGC